VKLGERASVHDKYCGELERGEGNPSLEVLQKLAAALEVDLATLVGDEVARLDQDALRAEAVRHVERLPEPQLRDLVRMFRLRSR
jgi:transcriptional regulator with XRE-family HTH domain